TGTHLGAQRHDVRVGHEVERLDGLNSSGVSIFESQIERRADYLRRWRIGRVQRRVQRVIELRVGRRDRKGQGLCGELILDELLRVSLLIEILLEPPALEACAAI